MDIPETRYAKTADGVHIAYQVVGTGPVDLVFVWGWFSDLEYGWKEPRLRRFYERLGASARLILFDKRGTGLSDRVPDSDLPDLETRTHDVMAVLDAAGSERAVIFGNLLGAPMAVLFAATYPGRTLGLVLFNPVARMAWAPDYPWGTTDEEHERRLQDIEEGWGTSQFALEWVRGMDPSMVDDQAFVRRFADMMRRSMSPGSAIALEAMIREMDVRDVIRSVHVPTLVASRNDEGEGQFVGEQIMGARIVEPSAQDVGDFVWNQDALLVEVERFLQELWSEEGGQLDRALATVLFTDIVGSTTKAAELGDRAWRETVERHHSVVRAMLARYRGTEVDTAGDGFFATFDGPARAVRAAGAIIDGVRPLGLDLRVGVHTGEVEMIDGKVGGLAVVIGARVGALASPGEVLVSSTVKDLTAGSGLAFADTGEHELKGVPDRWRLYRVADKG